MDGYTSYLSDFQPAPEYSREVLYPHAGSPLYQQLRARGILPETERIGGKVLDGTAARTYRTEGGGIAETLEDLSGAVVLVIIPPEQADNYRRYSQPLPLWAWLAG